MSRLIWAVGLALFFVRPSLAAIITPSVNDARFGFNRGGPNTFYSGWDRFTDDDGDSSNGFQFDSTPELLGSNGPGGQLATVADLSGATALTSVSRNIYALAGAPSFQVSIPSFDLGNGFTTRIVAQFRTQGPELLYSSLALNGIAPTFQQETGRSFIMGGNPAAPTQITVVNYLASWDVVGTAAQYQLLFASSAVNSSLDQLHIDGVVTAVPEPGTVSLLGMVSMAAWGWKLRARRRRANLLGMA